MFQQANIADMEEVSGTITSILFRSEENGYTVFRCETKADKKPITIVGCTLAREGESVSARGHWKNDPKYGRQFQAKSIIAVRPDSPKAIESYLASGVIRGIGPTMAKRIVAMYGEKTLDILDADPEAIAKVPGVGPKRVEQIKLAWKEQAESRRIMVFLANQNINGMLALRIYRQYGEDAISVIQSNPYRLAREVRGIGFLTADQIALDLGVPETSPQRIEAAIRHVLGEASGRGHCGLDRASLIRAASESLRIAPALIEARLDAMVGDGDGGGIRRHVLPDLGECFFVPALDDAERGIERSLKGRIGHSLSWRLDPAKIDDVIREAQAKTSVVLAEEQFAAVRMVLTNRVSILTGGPGTGKTSTLNVILRALSAVKARVVLAAPTGKAAKRMRETTGHEASTVARLIGMGMEDDKGVRTIECDILIIDEASMVDVMMFSRVLRALPVAASLLLVGDVDQLPSVAAGRVLADMIESGAVPVTRLTKVFRQAAQSAIIRNAHRINRGESLEQNAIPGDPSDFYWIDSTKEALPNRIVELVTERIPARIGCSSAEVQVLSPMRRGPVGTDMLNSILQAALNPNPSERITRLGGRIGVGDRVLQTVNNYDLGVMNGESGTVIAIDGEEETITVQVDDKLIVYPMADADQLTLAYAMTVHKSQGSQFPAVVIPVTTQHYMMLNRPVIYTAVTRASRFCVLIGERRAIEMAIRNARSEPRITRLLHLIRG